MYRSPVFEDLPLRQRKFALTKLGLLDAVAAAVRNRPLEEVSVKELCDTVGISEASFFNYFPKKTDVLVYSVQLWSLEMSWEAARFGRTHGALATIEQIFALTARQVAENPGPMGEIIAGQARMPNRPAFAEITLAERLLRFREHEGIADAHGEGLDELLPPLIARAIRDGELPANCDHQQLLIALAALFLGLPVVMRRRAPEQLELVYRAQLALLWRGMRAPQVAT